MISKVRSVVRKNLPAGYRETMNYGMITYEIPLQRFPETYNKQPLCYAGLAAQKNFDTIYLMGAYADPKERKRLEGAFRKSGKKMDMGKSCLHFRSTPAEKMIEAYETSRVSASRKPNSPSANRSARTTNRGKSRRL